MEPKETYDALIIGAGPAGLSCAIKLAERGKRALVLEQCPGPQDKVCGDGLSIFCVPELAKIGILEGDLISAGAALVTKKHEHWKGKEKTIVYEKPAFGLSRKALIHLLFEKAQGLGVEVLFGIKATKIERKSDFCTVNDCFAGKNVVNASGAVSVFRPKELRDLPFGVSSRIVAEAKDIEPDAYYFFYGPEYGNGYAWIFPIGVNLWNVGVWNGDKRKDVLFAYQDFVKRIFDTRLRFLSYDRKPGGAFIGATLKPVPNVTNAIGDAAFTASYSSGEGITFAVREGVALADNLADNAR